jgi:hypothetical protein
MSMPLGCQSHASRRISRAREFALPRSSDDVDNTISRITPSLAQAAVYTLGLAGNLPRLSS